MLQSETVVAKKPADTAVDRLKRRIADRIDAEKDRPRGMRRTQTGLADHLGITKATLNEALNGPSAQRGLLKHLDRIGDYFGVPPSLLVHKNDTAVMEVQQEEYRLLAHWRRFPPSVQERLMEMFDYFAGLLPEEQEGRRWWSKIQRIRKPSDRRDIEQAIDDVLSAQRTTQDDDATRVGEASSDATASAIRTRPNRRLR